MIKIYFFTKYKQFYLASLFVMSWSIINNLIIIDGCILISIISVILFLIIDNV